MFTGALGIDSPAVMVGVDGMPLVVFGHQVTAQHSELNVIHGSHITGVPWYRGH